MVEKDFKEIGVDVVLQKDQLKYMERNPEGLTKEGCQRRLVEVKMSHNRYLIRQFEHMVESCKNFETSGKTTDGKVILARLNGKVTWTIEA